jgi:sec-independent protein translocase protein TatA
MSPLLIGDLGTPELLIILAIVVLVFGASKLPELARGSGRALRIFKAETKGLMDDDDDTLKTDTQRSPEQRELGANPPSLDAESERQAAERRAADHRDDPA